MRKVIHFDFDKYNGNLMVLTDDGILWERVIVEEKEEKKFKFREITISNEDITK